MDLISLEQLGDKPSKQTLGKARRHNLELILATIPITSDEDVRELLKGNGLDKAKLSEKIGLGVKPVNLRQSFRDEIKIAEQGIAERGLTEGADKKTGNENAKLFISWLDEKLADNEFLWPITHKDTLYRRAIWAMFSEQDFDDVERTPSLFSRDQLVKNKLSTIDLKLAEGELGTQSYASETALDEMQDTMTNRQILSLNQKVKSLTEQLASERLEKGNLAKELKNLKKVNDELLSGDLPSIKLAGVH